ncbi:MAG: NAD(P)-binding domain-containing protein [Sediminibacterium sp.]|nr:NAD(P)-binding domain-containing protein [Sediminibacterium sp.]
MTNQPPSISLLGSGSWGTALAKIISTNGVELNWWFRNSAFISQFKAHKHHPAYLSHILFDLNKIHFHTNIKNCLLKSQFIIIAIPSAYIEDSLKNIPKNLFKNKIIISAVKGILPYKNYLLNEYLAENFDFPMENYYTLLGPSHAEEVVTEKTTYLTITGSNQKQAQIIANVFSNKFIITRTNNNVKEVQYAAILKNIYALGAGIADGLGYGDNFISSFIANCSREMDNWLIYLQHDESENYHLLQSVFLGDLLVTCYSMHSRNRRFGMYIGKGYSVSSANLELNMIAEGLNASRLLYNKYSKDFKKFFIALSVYQILWENKSPKSTFKKLEKLMF